MPFKSEAQRAWMHANKPEMAKEWEADTPAGPLPARVAKPVTQKEATRSPGRKKGLARLVRLASLGLLVGCAGSGASVVAPVDDAVVCREHLHGVIYAAPDCEGAVMAVDLLIQSDPKCKGFARPTYKCIKHDAGVQFIDGGK